MAELEEGWDSKGREVKYSAVALGFYQDGLDRVRMNGQIGCCNSLTLSLIIIHQTYLTSN